MTDLDRPPPTPELTRKDRAIARFVTFLSGLLYREVTVHWTTPLPGHGPVLTVSNHFGGLADGIVLLHVLPRRPGIIARDVIWKVPVVGRLMTWIGGIPVHKREDGNRPGSNAATFGSCFEALREGRHLLIFPEGVTRNEPSIARVKTGAARITLGAHDDGVGGIVIQPVGIHYEDKASLRSRVVVLGGRPISIDDIAEEMRDVDDDREKVVELTAEIDLRLRDAAPNFDDWEAARDLTDAADIALRSLVDDQRAPVPDALTVRLSNALAQRPAEHRARIAERLRDYQSQLDRAGVRDADVTRDRGRARTLVLLQFVALLVLIPFAVLGAVINLLPFLVVKLVGRLRVAPSMMSTIKPIAALLAFGGTWVVIIWRFGRAWGLSGAAAAALLLPVYLWATIVVAERFGAWWRTRGARTRRRRAIPTGDSLAGARAALVAEVWAR